MARGAGDGVVDFVSFGERAHFVHNAITRQAARGNATTSRRRRRRFLYYSITRRGTKTRRRYFTSLRHRQDSIWSRAGM